MPTFKEIIPWVISGLSLLFVILRYSKDGRKDIHQQEQLEAQTLSSIRESLLKANMKLDQVCTTTNETRTDIKSLNRDVQAIKEQVAIHERDIKAAFDKIDELRTIVNSLNSN